MPPELTRQEGRINHPNRPTRKPFQRIQNQIQNVPNPSSVSSYNSLSSEPSSDEVIKSQKIGSLGISHHDSPSFGENESSPRPSLSRPISVQTQTIIQKTPSHLLRQEEVGWSKNTHPIPRSIQGFLNQFGRKSIDSIYFDPALLKRNDMSYLVKAPDEDSMSYLTRIDRLITNLPKQEVAKILLKVSHSQNRYTSEYLQSKL